MKKEDKTIMTIIVLVVIIALIKVINPLMAVASESPWEIETGYFKKSITSGANVMIIPNVQWDLSFGWYVKDKDGCGSARLRLFQITDTCFTDICSRDGTDCSGVNPDCILLDTEHISLNTADRTETDDYTKGWGSSTFTTITSSDQNKSYFVEELECDEPDYVLVRDFGNPILRFNIIVPDPLDADMDGILNADDICPATPLGEDINADGCSELQVDTDEDGVPDWVDICPAELGSIENYGCPGSRTVTTEEIANLPTETQIEIIDVEVQISENLPSGVTQITSTSSPGVQDIETTPLVIFGVIVAGAFWWWKKR